MIHDQLRAQWQPGQTWETLVEGCTTWVLVSNHGHAQPLWDAHQEYRQRTVEPPPVLLMRTHVTDAVVLVPPRRG